MASHKLLRPPTVWQHKWPVFAVFKSIVGNAVFGAACRYLAFV